MKTSILKVIWIFRNIQLPKPENLDFDSYGNVDQYPEGLKKLIAR